MPIRGSGSNHAPDVPGYTLRDYGSRVGVYRIMDVLDKSVHTRQRIAQRRSVRKHLPIIEEGNKRNWEWLGHGMTNSVSMLDYPPEEERSIIHKVKEIITKAPARRRKAGSVRAWARPATRRTISPRKVSNTSAIGATMSSRPQCA